jgi:hypothetical protein
VAQQIQNLDGMHQPNDWRFLDVLKKKQEITDWTIAQKLMRNPAPPGQKKWMDYNRRLNNIISSYDDYDRMDFLKCVGTIVLS